MASRFEGIKTSLKIVEGVCLLWIFVQSVLRGNWRLKMYVLIEKHSKYVIFPILAIISASILFHQNGIISNGRYEVSVGNFNLGGYFLFIYLCLLFAAFVKKSDQRNVLIILAALPATYAGLPWTNRIFEYRGDFYKITNTDYWHILVLTLLTLFVSLYLLIAGWETKAFAISYAKRFIQAIYKGNYKVLTIVMMIPVLVLLAVLLKELWESLFLDYTVLGDYIYSELLLLVQNVSTFFLAFLGFAFLHPLITKGVEVAHSWNSELRDFSFKTYLTRRIASALYGFTYISLAGVIGLSIPVYTYEYFNFAEYLTAVGFLGPIFIFPFGVLVALAIWFLIMLIIRLTYEFTNAIIHIAENTSK